MPNFVTVFLLLLLLVFAATLAVETDGAPTTSITSATPRTPNALPPRTTRRPSGMVQDPYLQPYKKPKHSSSPSSSSRHQDILAQLQGQVTEAVDKLDKKLSQVSA